MLPIFALHDLKKLNNLNPTYLYEEKMVIKYRTNFVPNPPERYFSFEQFSEMVERREVNFNFADHEYDNCSKILNSSCPAKMAWTYSADLDQTASEEELDKLCRPRSD